MSTTNILDLNNRVDALENRPDAGATADTVKYNPTASHIEATNVQDAIDELSGEIAGLSADDVSYDGTDSGLSSVTVQSAIDETVNKIDTLEADDVSYDGTDSGLAANNVQGAIDELATIESSAVEVTGFGNFSFQRRAGICFVTYNGDCSLLDAGQSNVLGTVGDRYKPSKTTRIFTQRGNNDIQITVETNGEIKAYNYGTAITSGTMTRFGTTSYVPAN